MRCAERCCRRVGLLVLWAALAACGEPPQAEEAARHGDASAAGRAPPLGQLSAAARPLRYRVALKIDPDASHFDGHTKIDVELADGADGVWLHGKDLDVSRATVLAADGSEHEVRYREHTADGVARVQFPQALPAGTVTLTFDYRAPFNDSLEGLYRMKVDGRSYASTQFEATSARLVIPSFDEPRFKTPFDLMLEVREGHRAVTNTPEVSTEPGADGFRRITFARTRPLPTYLLAFIVGPWDERLGDSVPPSALRREPIPLSGFASSGKGSQLDYALANTGPIVQALEAYFGTAYPYRKLDIIAVPDFAAGAMENAGAITYREQLLLFQDDASIVRRQRFASVHAHELAHQWFGNLVTPEWWDDIWLNEAFATWMAAKVMDQLEPDQGYRLRQLGESLRVMHEDARVSARQIRQPIEEHSDIGAAFDGITYDKGGAVLSMLERFVGEENFKRGIQQYMAAHRFGNADARDFVRAVAGTRPDLPDGLVERAFFSFLEQPGTPLAMVDWSCDEGEATTVSVEQSRYLPLGSRGDPERQWLLPMCLTYGTAGQRHEHCELVQTRQARFELPGGGCPEYLMPNADGAGYYRFGLRGAGWQALLAAPDLNDAERLTVAANLSAAFHAGELRVAEYLSLVPGLVQGAHVEVATAPFEDLEWIHDHLLTAEAQRRLRRMLADYYADAASRVPLDERPTERAEVQLQSEMAWLYASLIESPAWRAPLAERAVRFLRGRKAAQAPDADRALPAHLRETAFAVAVEMQPALGAELLALLETSSDATLRQHVLRALAVGGDPALRERLRALMLTDVRDNDVHHILQPLLGEPDSRDETWQWLLANFDAVAERQPYWFRGSMVEYGSVFCSSDRANEIERVLGPKVASMGGGTRSLAQTLEQIRLCEALVRFHEDAARLEPAAGSGE